MRPLTKKKEKDAVTDDDEKERYEILDDDEKHEGEMSTHIHFEISAGEYGNDDGEGSGRIPRMSGIIRAATSESAKWALGTILGMILSRGKDEDDER